jgi:hypothetical protein
MRIYRHPPAKSTSTSSEHLTNALFDRIARDLGRIGYCPPQLVLDCVMHRLKFDLDRMFKRFGDRRYDAGFADAEQQFRHDGE